MKEKLQPILFLFLFIFSITSAQDYELVWEENFDGNSLNMANWTYDSPTGVWNWGANQELQYYSPDNVSVGPDGEGGNALIITAKKETRDGYQFTSGRIHSRGKQSFRYGKVEARIKLPVLANGLWPAFWMLGTEKGWPASGEIDILEAGHGQGIANSTQDRTFNGALHWQHAGSYAGYGPQYTAPVGTSLYQYNTFTMFWTPSKIEMYFNDETNPYFAMDITGADAEEFRDWSHYFILNMAVGGSFPGITNPNNITAPLPAKMMVDYIKVYQKKGGEDSGTTLPPESEWDTWFGEGGAGSVQYNQGNLATITVTNAGSQSYSVQLFKDNMELPDGTYELSFKAKADAERSMVVNVGKGLNFDPWFDPFMPSASFNLTTEWQTFTHNFTKSNAYPNGKLVFEVGKAISGTAATTVYFDDVVLNKPVGSFIKKNSKSQTLSLYPNPAKELVSVNVTLGSKVSLYNISGVLIKSKTAYESTVSFNLNGLENGIYFIESLGNTAKFIKE